MIQLGAYNEMIVHEKVDHGMYLVHPDEDLTLEGFDKVLLPNVYVEEGLKPGDRASFFIYLDSEDRIIATNLKPLIKVKEIAFLRCTQVNDIGAFFDIGLAKELLVPFKMQAGKVQEGRQYLVYMLLDEMSNRLIGTTKINQQLQNNYIKLIEGEEVDVIVSNTTSLGYNVVVNQKHRGLIFHSDVFQKLNYGDSLKAFVKTVREDGKLDIVLQQQGLSSIEPNARILVEKMKENDGELMLGDKSDPDEIYAQLAISKKSFKKAVGSLYKKKMIGVEPKRIFLI